MKYVIEGARAIGTRAHFVVICMLPLLWHVSRFYVMSYSLECYSKCYSRK